MSAITDNTEKDPHQNEKAQLIDKLEPSKAVDILTTKQTQYFALWTVYTVVQFTAGGFGFSLGDKFTQSIALSTIIGVWIFNIGHLNVVVECAQTIERLKIVIGDIARNDAGAYSTNIKNVFDYMRTSRFLPLFTKGDSLRVYIYNSLVHLSIDACATISIVSRVKWDW